MTGAIAFDRSLTTLTIKLSSTTITLKKRQLIILSIAVAVLLLFLCIPPWMLRVFYTAGSLLTIGCFSYFAYQVIQRSGKEQQIDSPSATNQIDEKQSDERHGTDIKHKVSPSYYVAPMVWVDPDEQERIDKATLKEEKLIITAERKPEVEEESKQQLPTPIPASPVITPTSRPPPPPSSPPPPRPKPAEVPPALPTSIPHDPHSFAVKAHRYAQVHAEMLSTEATYIKALETCVSCYVLPLQQRVNHGELKLTPADMSLLFSNIEAILKFHLMLGAELKKALPHDIGSVFSSFAPYFKIYILYVSNYSACIQCMSKLSMNKAFAAFLATQRATPAARGLDLMSYLIQPIQRIPRYEMLLQQLLAAAPTNSTTASLQAAMRDVHSIAVMVNERKREAENASLILELQHRMRDREGGGSLLQPHRKLVRVGECVLRVGEGKKEKRVGSVLVLFNDLLVWCKQDYEYKGEVLMKDIQRVTPLVDELTIRISYQANKKEATLLMELENKTDQQSWQCSLQQYQTN